MEPVKSYNEFLNEADKFNIGDTLEIPTEDGKVKMKVIMIDPTMVKGDWLNAPEDSATKTFSIKKKDLNKSGFKILG